MKKVTKETKNEINDRIIKLKEHFEKGDYERILIEPLDYYEVISVWLKTKEYIYPFHFPAFLSDDEIIKETEDTLNSNGASEYSLVDWRPPVYGEGPQKRKPSGAF